MQGYGTPQGPSIDHSLLSPMMPFPFFIRHERCKCGGCSLEELVYEGAVHVRATCVTSRCLAESVFQVYAMILRDIPARTVAQTEHGERAGSLLHKIIKIFPSSLQAHHDGAPTPSDNRAGDGSVLLRVDDPSALGKLNAGANPTCG